MEETFITTAAIIVAGPFIPYFGLVAVIFGFFSWLTGAAIARNWRPIWSLFAYIALLAAAARFLFWGLYEGQLWSVQGSMTDYLILLTLSALSYRIRLVRAFAQQYPWLYRRYLCIFIRPVEKDDE